MFIILQTTNLSRAQENLRWESDLLDSLDLPAFIADIVELGPVEFG